MSPKNLQKIRDEILAAARHMREDGEIPAAVLIYFADAQGNLTSPTAFPVESFHKDTQAEFHQQAAAIDGVVASVLVNEAWTCTLQPGEEIDGLKVSERPDREEIFLANLLTSSRQYLLTAKIRGKEIDQADFEEINRAGTRTSYSGRFIREGAPAPTLQ